jgi:isoquinoline 1-oxidoreductase subunit alpha
MAITFNVNGASVTTHAPAATPLLWVLREQIKLTGTKFGCGAGLCGACMVHIDGERAFSCQVQLSEVSGRSVTTIEVYQQTRRIHCRKRGLRKMCRNAAIASPGRS